ncbi:MAG: threonylcarbamoyl-AMP synthase [Rhizobium sp.]|nr:threonylcarbamoyl-AMP synthase [Rhizobium sp.]
MAELIDIEMEPERALTEAVRILASGEPVAIPTETVYGLAADATNPSAISRIYEVKGRPRFNPLIAHMSGLEMAVLHAEFDPISHTLAQAFWPGPLTLVLPLKPESPIHELCTAGLPTIGIRVPEGFAGLLISAFGRPLAAPSANISGRISPTSAQHVAAELDDKIGLILDGGAAGVGVESTIIKVEGDAVRLLRPGGLDVTTIEDLLGIDVLRSDHAEAIEAPGMLASHYAPNAGVRMNVTQVHEGEVLVNFGNQDIAGAEDATEKFDLSPGGDLREAAANLFAIMKKADALGASAIAFAPVPMDSLGEAINDRLARAAAPRQ